jgi:microcystin-dependent protein
VPQLLHRRSSFLSRICSEKIEDDFFIVGILSKGGTLMADQIVDSDIVQHDVHSGRRGFLGRLLGAIASGFVLAKPATALERATPGAEPNEQQARSTSPLSTLDADPWLGEIALVPFSYAPKNWALCNGQLLPISQNATLFSLIGTTYGGDGQTTFGLPDLRGRAPIHQGQGIGLSVRVIGELAGEEAHTLALSEIPKHGHSLMADPAVGSSDSPANAAPAKNAAGIPQYSSNTTTAMSASAVGLTGGGGGHNNMPPFLVMNYIIALVGTFPSPT